MGLLGQVAGAPPCPPPAHLMPGPPATSLLKLPWPPSPVLPRPSASEVEPGCLVTGGPQAGAMGQQS